MHDCAGRRRYVEYRVGGRIGFGVEGIDQHEIDAVLNKIGPLVGPGAAPGNAHAEGGEVALRVQRRLGPGRGKRTILIVLYIRSEEHTSELQSLMRNSYAVFCLKKKKNIRTQTA